MQWSEQCPARGAGLTHAHWRECRPEHGGHPSTDPTTEYAGRHHAYDQCCHCEERIERAATPAEQPVQAIRDHAYLPTMSGWCAKCRQPQNQHEAQVHLPSRGAIEEQADAFGLPIPCTVDHNAITRKLLIGDEGYQWTSCPSCRVQLEGKLYTGNYTGRNVGHGRGEATPRFLKRVEAYVGWFAHLFGNAS
jgi:hypothetical protein